MASRITQAPFQVVVPEGSRGTLWDTIGSLIDFTYGKPGENFPGVEWRPIEPFVATLKIASMRRGRSAAQFVLADESGAHFPMFLIDTLALLQHGNIESGGKITATWIVCKRGANYGIRLADEQQA